MRRTTKRNSQVGQSILISESITPTRHFWFAVFKNSLKYTTEAATEYVLGPRHILHHLQNIHWLTIHNLGRLCFPLSAASTISVMAMTASSSWHCPTSCSPTGAFLKVSGESSSRNQQSARLWNHERDARTQLIYRLILLAQELMCRFWLIKYRIYYGYRENASRIVQRIPDDCVLGAAVVRS